MADTYTYRNGKRVALNKRDDQFVVRALPEKLTASGFPDTEKMSPASSRVTVAPAELESAMARARAIAPTHHAYERAETGQEFLITDRIVVTFQSAPTPQDLDEFARRYSLVRVRDYSDREFVFQLTNHTGMNPVKLVVLLTEKESVVAQADHDLNQHVRKYAIPTEPGYVNEWHLHTRLSHPEFDPRSSSNCEAAWQLLGNFGSSDVVVGVTDDGCLISHQDFDSPDKFAGWAYWKGNQLFRRGDIGANPASMFEAPNDHGTACAGVVAGESDAALTVGAAPGCRLLPVKWPIVDDGLTISDTMLRDVIDYLADKVDVVSSSWGLSPVENWLSIVTNRIAQLATTGGRRGKGIVFLWAAGNENCPIDHSATIDVPYTDGVAVQGNSLVWIGVDTAREFEHNLVGIPNVMYVAALASTAQRSHYSNYGAGIALCAPTNNVHEYHRLSVPGLGILTTAGPTPTSIEPEFGGTSSATPLTAGVAALVISANPALTAVEVISILKSTASKNLNFTGYAKTPPATFDPSPTWDVSPIAPFDSGNFQNINHPDGSWSPWFGHGRVDAEAAVAEALRRLPVTPKPTTGTHFESKPSKSIPDNDPKGIKDAMHVTAAGTVQAVTVAVEIRHTWIGDLRVTLTAPDGTAVVLHDRTGASQKDLVRSYDMTSSSALFVLKGKTIAGKWTLQVQDTASRDEGKLEKWSLDFAAAATPLIVEDVAALLIPDDDPQGVERTIQLPSGRFIGEISVGVDITHPWIGDLRVTLTPPNGAAIVLHERSGGDADNLIRLWRSTDVAALVGLRGKDAGGTWKLKVADAASRDEGKLNRWRIEIS